MSNEELVMAFRNGDKSALDQIIENNQGLIHHFVNQYYNLTEISYLERDDLVQLGNIGLIEAAKGFDPDYDVKFSTYAGVAIKGHISRGLRFSSPWEKRSDRESDLCHVISAHELIPGADETTYIDLIEDPSALNAFHLVNEEVDRLILREDLFRMLDRVFNPEDKEKNALILNYGLNGQEYTLKEIACLYDVSPERARQWTAKGLRKIRSSVTGKELMSKYRDEYVRNTLLPKLLNYAQRNHCLYTQTLGDLEGLGSIDYFLDMLMR
nr:sigma-70 family RNA polymerase sigma factor [uncultured Acetobacterium sp.]